jgi:HD-GYP domain-containing protein (c-di-GMP phosphodiesterase class II)
MSVQVFLSPDVHSDRIVSFLQEEGIEISNMVQSREKGNSGATFFVVDQKFLENSSVTFLNDSLGGLVVVNREADFAQFQFPETLLVDYCIKEVNLFHLRNLIQTALLRQQIRTVRQERDTQTHRLKELNRIGVALSTERDPVRLMKLILQKSRELTSADGGSLYLVEFENGTPSRLRFNISQNDSMALNYEESVMPLTKESIAAYVAVTGKALRIPDVYHLSGDHEYRFNRSFDERTGYRTVSTLAVPMKNHRGEITGVIQVVNRKKNFGEKLNSQNYADVVEPFDQEDEEFISSLASQAAVALENNQLIQDIERLFEGFVTAAVTAIESRDPTTSGHSFRVAHLTVALAEKVSSIREGKFGEVNFSSHEIKEMRYAALLHDFGKVGVRENVLVKAKKLYPSQLEMIQQRFECYKKAWEAELYKSKLNLLLTRGTKEFVSEAIDLENSFKRRLNTLEAYLDYIAESNEPTITPDGSFDKLLEIASKTDMVPPGVHVPLLLPEELQLLSIRKGSLNDKERLEIQSHVTHTFLFLSKIPWTSDLKRVPEIAYGHHEKLNGSGYPNKLNAAEIPIQTRMMTISDIYDALTAWDRPYKRAVPAAAALDIIAAEAKVGQIDRDLFDLFVDARIFEQTAPSKTF